MNPRLIKRFFSPKSQTEVEVDVRDTYLRNTDFMGGDFHALLKKWGMKPRLPGQILAFHFSARMLYWRQQWREVFF